MNPQLELSSGLSAMSLMESGPDEETCWLLELMEYSRAQAPLVTCHHPSATGVSKLWACLDPDVAALPRSSRCFTQIYNDPKLDCRLPRRGSACTAGAILRHAFDTMDKLTAQHWPMVYKIGFTHDPHARFWNSRYGYAADNFQKWQSMVIVFASPECVGPSYVEAALVQKYKGFLAIHRQAFPFRFWMACLQ